MLHAQCDHLVTLTVRAIGHVALQSPLASFEKSILQGSLLSWAERMHGPLLPPPCSCI